MSEVSRVATLLGVVAVLLQYCYFGLFSVNTDILLAIQTIFLQCLHDFISLF
jgi:hypothetical protein